MWFLDLGFGWYPPSLVSCKSIWEWTERITVPQFALWIPLTPIWKLFLKDRASLVLRMLNLCFFWGYKSMDYTSVWFQRFITSPCMVWFVSSTSAVSITERETVKIFRSWAISPQWIGVPILLIKTIYPTLTLVAFRFSELKAHDRYLIPPIYLFNLYGLATLPRPRHSKFSS